MEEREVREWKEKVDEKDDVRKFSPEVECMNV